MAASFELTLFQEYYTTLCHTITDITTLVRYFVQERIISIDEVEVIENQSTTSEKVTVLLRHISGPLAVCDNRGFYVMLEITKNHGTLATSNLADKIKDHLTSESNIADFTV